MSIVWFFFGLLFLGWLLRQVEENPPKNQYRPANVKISFSKDDPGNRSISQKEYQKRHRIWTTQINGSGVDPNSYWGKIREEIFRRYHDCCANCGSVENLTVHHKQPLSLGGDNDLDNLVLLCKDCHEAGHGRKFLGKTFDSDNDYGRQHRLNEKVLSINDAIKHNKTLQIKYTDMYGVRSLRTIHPTKIRKRNKSIYTQAFCDLDKDVRTFRLSRMRIMNQNRRTNCYIDKPKDFSNLDAVIAEDFKKLFS